MRPRDPRTLRDTPVFDGIVPDVTIVDPHHALAGQRLPVVSLRSARGPSFLVVSLADGRRRSVRRSATDLAANAASSASPEVKALVSVRILLPLARHLRVMLASSAEEVIHHGHSLAPASRCIVDASPDPKPSAEAPGAAKTMERASRRLAKADRRDSLRCGSADALERSDDEGGG